MTDFLERLIARHVDSSAAVGPRPLALFEPPESAGPRSEEAPAAGGSETEAPAPAAYGPRAPMLSAAPALPAPPVGDEPVTAIPAPAAPLPSTPHAEPNAVLDPVLALEPPTQVASASPETSAPSGVEAAAPQPLEAPSPPALVPWLAPERRPDDPPAAVPRKATSTSEDPVRIVERIAENGPPPTSPPPDVEQTIAQPGRRQVTEPETPEALTPSLPSIVRQMVFQPVVHELEREPASEQQAPPAFPAGTAPEMAPPVVALQPLPERSRRAEAPPPLLKPSADQVPAFPELPPQAPPTIRITIGRVEVRAVASEASAPAKPRPQPALMSLDDYLTQRTNGDGS